MSLELVSTPQIFHSASYSQQSEIKSPHPQKISIMTFFPVSYGKAFFLLNPEKTWSQVDLQNLSDHSEEFAKATWKCSKCGFKNNIDVYACGVCGRDRP